MPANARVYSGTGFPVLNNKPSLMKKALSNYLLYSFKVIVGAVILLLVAIGTAPEMFREKFRMKELD